MMVTVRFLHGFLVKEDLREKRTFDDQTSCQNFLLSKLQLKIFPGGDATENHVSYFYTSLFHFIEF